MIIALLLPKGASRQCHPCVGPLGRDALKRLGHLTQGVVVDCLHDHVRKLWLAKVERTGEGLVEQAVQGGKGLSRVDRGDREGSIRRQTAVKTPSDENRLL